MSIIPRAFLLAALPLIIGASDAPAESITPEAMRAHVEFLASDSLEGRETGTRGYDIAAEYVATRFRAVEHRDCGGNRQCAVRADVVF